eukprot:TRINITY_DN21950_c0_g1_i1.p1 TRINITY_DN21950_c0_g1~~TRINITY_DN21950_c0_g1_i1.p1  ORF type:complete len:365 (+),score=100.67 TRINITY_DN21950_c0_g1_i1:208-1302(+)
MSKFQVQLSHHWKDYPHKYDKMFKTCYLSGKKTAHFNMTVNGKKERYEVNFEEMTQRNLVSKGKRKIRPPYGLKAPEGDVVDADGQPIQPGPMICIKVPEGAAGSMIQVPHPKAKGKFFEVRVPADARVGQAMLVPVPPWKGRMDPVLDVFKKFDTNGDGVLSFAEMKMLIEKLNLLSPTLSGAEIGEVLHAFDENENFQIEYEEFAKFLNQCKGGGAPVSSDDDSGGGGSAGADSEGGGGAAGASKGGGWSTGAKVVAGGGALVIGGAALIAGGAVAGALLADGDLDGLGDALGDIAGDAGDAIGDVAGDAGDAIADVAGDAADAIADLAGDAGDAIGDVAEDAGEWIVGAAEDAGDFVMDLF